MTQSFLESRGVEKRPYPQTGRRPFAWRFAELDRRVVIALGALFAACYLALYLGDPALPGNDPAEPLGWWGWFDQSVTLRSTAALVAGSFDPAKHHYPLGYSLLAAPFYSAMPKHAFFAVDLLSFLGAFAGFVALARRMAVPGVLAAALFGFATLADPLLFREWIVPWNTTPVAAFVWLLLGSAAAWLDGQRRPFRIGLLIGAIAACRPSDVLCALPPLVTLAIASAPAWRTRRRESGLLIAGLAVVLLPLAALHVAIYGLHQSPYMASSARIGFTRFDLGWKAYVLFVDPYPWFADGVGILQHAHWVALGLAGLFPALLRDAKSRMLAGVLVVHGLLYASYVDLLPTGLWRFLNIHYFAWAFPGYALLAALLIRDLLTPRPTMRRCAIGWISLAATLSLLCLRVVPAPARGEAAKAIDFSGPLPPFLDTYMDGRLALRDNAGVLHDQRDMRVFLYPGGVRVVGMRRDIRGVVHWLPGQAPKGFADSVPTARWRTSIRFAWPPSWWQRGEPSAIPIPTS